MMQRFGLQGHLSPAEGQQKMPLQQLPLLQGQQRTCTETFTQQSVGQHTACDHYVAAAKAPAHQNMTETFLTPFSKRNFKSRNVFLSTAATFRQAAS